MRLIEGSFPDGERPAVNAAVCPVMIGILTAIAGRFAATAGVAAGTGP